MCTIFKLQPAHCTCGQEKNMPICDMIPNHTRSRSTSCRLCLFKCSVYRPFVSINTRRTNSIVARSIQRRVYMSMRIDTYVKLNCTRKTCCSSETIHSCLLHSCACVAICLPADDVWIRCRRARPSECPNKQGLSRPFNGWRFIASPPGLSLPVHWAVIRPQKQVTHTMID